MRISCAVCVPVSVVTAAVLLALVPASMGLIEHHGSGTYNYPPNTTGADEDVKAWDTTKVNVLADGLIGRDLNVRGTSTVTVSGGLIGDDLFIEDDSTVNVSGGLISTDLYARDNSMVTVSGGTIGGDLSADHNSTVTVSGGSIGGDYLRALGSSTLTIIGSDFNFAYGDYFVGGPLDAQTLTGLLADGTAIDNTMWISSTATLTLAAPSAAVPEPATAALVLLGAGGLMCRRRAA